MRQNCVRQTTRNVMMDSFLPVLKDRVEAILTLEGLVHERRGYAGTSIDTREHEIQASSIRFATNTFIHMNPPMHIRLSDLCTSILYLTIGRTVFIEHRCEKSLRSDPSREPTAAPT